MNKNRINSEESGQALVELSVAFVIMCVFVFGVIDFGRAIYDTEVMRNLSGEGSSMASRGTSNSITAAAIAGFAGTTIDLTHKGCVIVTTVTNNGGTLQVTAQAQQCAITATSKIGCVQGQGNCRSGTPTLPTGASTALLNEVSGSSISITEIYYSYSTVTPIMGLLKANLLPSQLYSVAYY
jgi:Flp pilus assembly protein TadG